MTQAGKETFPLAQPDRARPVPRPRRKRDHALAVILLASLAIHATVFAPMLFSSKTVAPPSVETPVEVIQEPPPEPKTQPAKSGRDAAEEAREKAEKAKAKAEKAKADQAKTEQAKAEAEKAKAEQAKAEAEAEKAKAKQAKAEADQAKADQAKAEQAKARQAKAEAEKAKAEQAKPTPAERKAAQPRPQKAAARTQPTETQEQVDARMRALLGLPPSVDHAALPGESVNGTEGATYEQMVMSHLTKALSMDRRPGRPGYATVTFVVGDRGEVTSVVLNRASGDPLLDTEATEVVRRGAPYPVPPPGAKRDYTVTLQSKPVP